MHPLVNDLSNLTNEELQSKYSELMKRYNQAFRIGPTSVIPQLQMILENYRTEIDNRNQKIMREMEEKNNKFKGIIDIK